MKKVYYMAVVLVTLLMVQSTFAQSQRQTGKFIHSALKKQRVSTPNPIIAKGILKAAEKKQERLENGVQQQQDYAISGAVEPCTDFMMEDTPIGGGPFVDLNTAGLPCGDSCDTPAETTFSVWSNEGYTLDNLLAGSIYELSICEGLGAGSWDAVLTVAYWDGATQTIGEVVVWAEDCSVELEVPEDGNYLVVITEAGNCDGASPNQVDNGSLTVSCIGENPCEEGGGGGGGEAEACTDFIQGASGDGAGGPFTNLNLDAEGNFVPLPCGDACDTPAETPFSVWSNEGYTMDNLAAGSVYELSICTGTGAGSWDAVLTVAYWDGATVGEVVVWGEDCSLEFEVPEDGNYIVVVTEAGNCDGASPNGIDNGVLTVSCVGENPCGELPECDIAITATAASISACSGEEVTLDITAELGTIYEQPTIIWLANGDVGPDGELGTADDVILADEPLEGDIFQAENAVLVGLDVNTVAQTLTNTECEAKPYYFYASILEGTDFTYSLGICNPYPTAEIIVNVAGEPGANSFSVQDDGGGNCGFIIVANCQGTLVTPTSYTASSEPTNVTISVVNDCNDYTEVYNFEACQPTGIEEAVAANFAITALAPVPAISFIDLAFMSKNSETVSVQIYDVTGKLVAQQNINEVQLNNTLRLDIANYSAGVYFISLSNNQYTVTDKFVKE